MNAFFYLRFFYYYFFFKFQEYQYCLNVKQFGTIYGMMVFCRGWAGYEQITKVISTPQTRWWRSNSRSFTACRKLNVTFANNLEPYQAQHNIRPDQDPVYLTPSHRQTHWFMSRLHFWSPKTEFSIVKRWL